MTTFVHYALDTGEIVQLGGCATAEECEKQVPPEGQALAIIQDGVLQVRFDGSQPDLTRLKAVLSEQIDKQASEQFQLRQSAITGADARHAVKALEALRWTEGDELEHPERYPFLLAEAAARSTVSGTEVNIAQVVAGVQAKVRTETAAEAAIEAHRVAHRQLVADAATFGAVVIAGRIDWSSLISAAIAGASI